MSSFVPSNPLYSVIVPAYNAADTLPLCLDALAAQTTLGAFEVIVVDDGSSDRTALVAGQAGARVVRQSRENQAAARNCGARSACGEILLFTDADCAPAPDWVERMVVPFDDPSVVGVKGRYCSAQRGLIARFVQHEFEESYRQFSQSESIDFVDGHAAAYRRKEFFSLGGFDPTYPLVEDIELSFRAAEAGHKLVFAAQAAVFHKHRETLTGYVITKLRAAARWVSVYRRHPKKVGRDSRQPRIVSLQIALAPPLASLAPFAPFFLLPARLLMIGLGLFVATTLPSAWRAYQKDHVLGLAVPLFAYIRAISQAAGVALGILRWPVP